MKIVHVTSEANARPTITAFTMISAERNIDQGESSCSVTLDDLAASIVAVPLSTGAVAAARLGCTVDTVAPVDIFGSDPAVFCWAKAGVPIAMNASTKPVLRTVLNIRIASRIPVLCWHHASKAFPTPRRVANA